MEASLYYGMIWRGVMSGLAAYSLIVLPPYPDIHWGRVAVATGLFVALMIAIVIGARGARSRQLTYTELLMQNVLANGAIAVAMWAGGSGQGSLVPLLFVIIIYNTSFKNGWLSVMSWVNGTATHLVGSLLAGGTVWPSVTSTVVFAACAAGIQVSVSYLVGRVRHLATGLELEREIAATAARVAGSDSAFADMLPRSAELLDVTSFALVAIGADGPTVVAAVHDGTATPVAVADLNLADGAVVGETTGGDLLVLCVGRDDHPDPKTFAAVRDLFAPVVERARYLSGLQLLAQSDGLTGLANRRHLDDTLRGLDRTGGRFAVIIIDLDRFKELNDTRGHLAGDDVLVAAAQVIGAIARSGDVSARYGGEEFCIVMPDEDLRGASGLERRLRTAWQAAAIPVGFSAGIAERRDGDSSGDVLRRADAALYTAKASGRGRAALER